MNTLVKMTYTEASLVRTFISMHLGYRTCTLVREFELIKTITENVPEAATQRLIQRNWNIPTGIAYISLYQHASYFDVDNATQHTVVLFVNRQGVRIVEVTSIKLNQPRTVVYSRFLGDRDTWEKLIERSGKVIDEPIKYDYPTLTDASGPICIVGPMLEGSKVGSDGDTTYNPRYNMLLDKEHLETSDNQHDMVEVVHRLVNGINWLDRARTDRPYIHEYQVEGRYTTNIKLVLFPDRSKLTIVKRLEHWEDTTHVQTWIGVNPYNDTTKAYLEKAGLVYDAASHVFVNPEHPLLNILSYTPL